MAEPQQHLLRVPKYAEAKAEAMASFAAFTRGEVDVPKYPLEVFIEVSNLCNARCVMCTVFSAFNPHRLDRVHVDQRKHMVQIDDVLAQEELFAHALNVHLYGFGEPTIHPRFKDIIRHTGKYEVIIDFFTNGMKLLDAGLIDTIIEAQVERVTISFSGSTKEEYESVYQGCSWDTVTAGMRELARRKRLAGSQYPEVFINSLGWAHHLRSIDTFVELMAELGATAVEIKQLLPYKEIPQLEPHVGRIRNEQELETLQRARRLAQQFGLKLAVMHDLDRIASGGTLELPPPANNFMPIEAFRKHAGTVTISRERPPPRSQVCVSIDDGYETVRDQLGPSVIASDFHCMEPFKTMYIRQEGLTKPCCFTADQAHALGDVSRAGGIDVWRGHGHQALREASVQGRYPERGCGGCIRRKDGPPEHFVHYLFRRYRLWFGQAFGVPFARDPGPIVAPGATIMQLRAMNGDSTTIVKGFANDASQVPFTEGYVDAVGNNYVNGWVWAPEHRSAKIPVTIHLNGRPVLMAVANEFRQDLIAAGKGDGYHGFSIQFPPELWAEAGDVIGVTVAQSERHLENSPRTVPYTGPTANEASAESASVP